MFEVSIWISATRCLLTYIILPFVFPIIGVSANDHAIGLPVSVIAVIADVASIRRFWRADHKYRWHYTALAGAIICAMLVLITGDLIDLSASRLRDADEGAPQGALVACRCSAAIAVRRRRRRRAASSSSASAVAGATTGAAARALGQALALDQPRRPGRAAPRWPASRRSVPSATRASTTTC